MWVAEVATVHTQLSIERTFGTETPIIEQEASQMPH